MTKKMKILFNVFLFFLPWTLRRNILNYVFSYKISPKSKIGLSIVICDKLVMEEGSVITHMTFINDIDCCRLGKFSKIGRNNWITGLNTKYKNNFTYNEGRSCELVLGEHARITPKHTIDCSGGVYVGEFTTVAGTGTQILTHSIDIELSRQTTGPVHIGKYSFVGTACIFLKNSTLPNYSILGAGSVLNKSHTEELCLYGGVPAKVIKKLDMEENLYFSRQEGSVN